MEPELDRTATSYSPATLVLRQPETLWKRIEGYLILVLCAAVPAFMIYALRGVSLRCERADQGAEPTCAVDYDYGVLRMTIPVLADDVRLARYEDRTSARTKNYYCMTVVPRRAESDLLDITSGAEAHQCEGDIDALRVFFATPAAMSVLVARDWQFVWWPLLVVAPIWGLALFGGLLHLETRRVTVDRESGHLVVVERALARAFVARTIHTVPIAKIHGIRSRRSLGSTEFTVIMRGMPTLELWKSSDDQATNAAADRLAEAVGAPRM